jgi:2-polyprenyl-3-methyl-5-hydroxy-6-metoxy-1,4-benzoquinol methylase
MSEFTKYERSGAYHWIQADPDWRNVNYNAPLVARYNVLLNQIPLTSRTILDVGCGDGYLLHLLYKRRFKFVVGMDNYPFGVRLAQGKLQRCIHAGRCEVTLGSVYDLLFSANSFDCVVMADVIEHLDEPKRALTEVSRVLKQDGVFVLSTPNSQQDRIWDKLHVQEFSAKELRGMLTPFFERVSLFGCWPMWCFRLWGRGGGWRRLLASFARLGFNLFEFSTKNVSSESGQLIAVCSR